MHFVTSTIFLPTLALKPSHTRARTLDPPLSLRARLLLVRAYLIACGVWVMVRPRPSAPALSIAALYAATDAFLTRAPAPHAYALGQTPEREFYANTQRTMPVGARAWTRVLDSAIVHPNEHLPKLIRALAAADTWYGARRAGSLAGALDVAGIAQLDGSVFLRVAALSMERLGWAAEEDPKAQWDRVGYWDAVTKADRPAA